MGLPLFIDYYVSHTWNMNLFEAATMRFLPNGRDIKPLPEKGELPSAERVFQVELATKDVEDAESKAFGLAVFIAVAIIAIIVYIIFTT